MSENKSEEADNVSNVNSDDGLNPTQLKLKQIYKQVVEDPGLREYITQQINLKTHKYTDKITEEEGYLEGNMEEADLKPLIRKWRGEFMKDEIKNFAKNHLYVTDTTMGKKDLERNLKVLDNNIDAMGTTNGFERIEKQLGLNDKLLKKNSKIGALKPAKELEPFIAKRETYEDKKKHQEEEFQKHMDEANQLMNKLNEEKKQRKDKIKELRQKRNQNKEKREADKLKKQEEVEEKKRQELEDKHKAIEDKINQMKEERKKNLELIKENTKKIEKPKYTSIQHNYEEKVLMPTLEKKKEALKSLRNLHKPIDLAEIREHGKKMDDIVEKQKEKLYKERTQLYETHRNNYNYKEYETNYLKAIMEQEMHEKEEATKKEIEKRELTDKMKSYGEMVKEMHWPTVSKKKQLEMQLLKESMKHPVRKLNKSHLSAHNLHSHRGGESVLGMSKGGIQSDMEDDKSQTIKRRKLIWKENPMVPKPKPKKDINVSDWLEDRRIKREQREKEGIRKGSPVNHWKKEIENHHLNQQERYDYIKERTKQLEDDARRKEEMITIAKSGTIQDRDQVNDMIFESIKAKLSILEDFNS